MDRRDPRIVGAKVSVLFALVLTFAAAPAVATPWEPELYSMEVLVDGVPLPEYAARSTVYVEALEGREYSIRLRNRTGGRIAVALSVDGLNTIDARVTSSREASKWILGPYETITLDGWQTSHSTARRFFFTSEPESYGAWLGETGDLGVITAVVFREKRREPDPVYRPYPYERELQPRREGAAGPAPSSAPLEGKAGRADSGAGVPESQLSAGESLSDDLAATGIGRETDHRVRRVRFDAERRPAAVLSIRYEYHDALVALGVLPEPRWSEDGLARRERARGFRDLRFAPDPYRPR